MKELDFGTRISLIDSFSEVSRKSIFSKDKLKYSLKLAEILGYPKYIAHIPKDPFDTFVKTPKKVAFVIPYWLYGGGSSVGKWTRSVNLHGNGVWGAESISGSTSGKVPKLSRDDYQFTNLKWKNTEFAIQYFKNFDLICIYDCDPYDLGVSGLKKMPSWADAFLGMESPIILVVCNRNNTRTTGDSLLKRMLKKPNVRAFSTTRESLVRITLESGILGDRDNLPWFMLRHHPNLLGEFCPNKFSEKKIMLNMSRLAFCKRIPELLKASVEFKSDLRLEIWGTFVGRAAWKIYTDWGLGNILDPLYVGQYKQCMLDDIYSRASFAIDLTNVAGDGGMQNVPMEAMERGVIPIVTKGWDNAPGMLSAGETVGRTTVENVIEGYNKAVKLTEDECIYLQYQSWDWLTRERNPKTLVNDFLSFAKEYVLK